jgi:pyruvate kinase
MPAITEKDRADLVFALEQQVDYVALSFVQEPADIEQLRSLMQAQGRSVPIIAKIERKGAIERFEAVLEAADAIMVARGDLGLEVPAEEVPIYQKRLISLTRAAGKPVITATQMLESMMTNPRPTRAEASDVANAIMDGSDAVMLSGETAAGKYPVAAVQMMSRIARVTERHLPYREWAQQTALLASGSVTEAITQACTEIATELGAKAIIAATSSGWTARMVAKNRPQAPIISVTPDGAVVGQLALVWGVAPLLVPSYSSTDEMTHRALELARARELLLDGDLVVLTAGVPLGLPGRTNMIQVHRVGECL